MDYSTIDLPLITVLLERERVHKLNEAMEHFAPENLRTWRRRTLLNKKTQAIDDVKPVVKWYKEKDSIQLLVEFWDTDTMIDILKPLAEKKSPFSIYDIVRLTDYLEERKRAGFVNGQDLQLPLPPRMRGPALLEKKLEILAERQGISLLLLSLR